MKTFEKSFIKIKPLRKASAKAQSAMEYLMTYGWAILIVAVVIVLGSLYILGVFNGFAIHSGIVAYVPITITNSQSSATPSPFQQMINITESNYANYIAYNGKIANFKFFTQSGQVLPAWIESNNSDTLTIWVKLPNGIPASSSLTIYLGFASKTTNLLSSSGTSGIGEAPQLSSTYGEYDNGASVFNNYWNFAGTSLPSGWQTTNSGYSVNNGLIFDASSSSIEGIGTTSAVASPGLLEMYVTGNYGRIVLELSTSSNFYTLPAGMNWYDYGYLTNYGGYVSPPDGAFAVVLDGSAKALGNFDSSNKLPQVFGLGWIATGNEFSYTYNSNPLSPSMVTSTDSSVSIASSLYMLIGQMNSGDEQQGGTWRVYWLRTRAYPPNGVMPSVSFGGLSSA